MFRPFSRSIKLLSRRDKAIFFLILFTRVVINLLDVLGLIAVGFLGAILSSDLSGRPSASFFGMTYEITSSRAYLWFVALIALFFISKSVTGVILLRVSLLYLARIESTIAVEIGTFLYSGSLTRLQRFSRGDIAFAIGASPNTAISGLLMSGSAILSEGALFLLVFAVFLVVDTITAFFVSAYFLLLVAIFQLAVNRRLRLIGERLRESSIAVGNSIQNMTVAFREISVFSKRTFFLDNLSFFRRRSAFDNARLSFLLGLPRFFVESALMVGVLALVGFQFLRGNLSEGLVTTAVFLAGGLRMLAALLPIQSAVANIKTFGPQAELAQNIVVEARTREAAEKEDDGYRSSVIASSPDEGFPVTVSDIAFSYSDSNKLAIKNVSIAIPPGAFVAFVGPSGAGKTTLADLILGINTPSQGSIRVADHDPTMLREMQPGAIAYVPQNPGLVTGSIANNVALGETADSIDLQRVWEALEKAELVDFVRGLPNGIHSNLGKQADALSGGQKQRVGLARALYTRPRLLVLDEATSGLDASTEANVAETIRRMGVSTTVIVIAHRLSTIQHADMVFVLEDGSVRAQGKFSEVRNKVPLIEEYVRLMMIED